MLDYALIGVSLRATFELPGGGEAINVPDVVAFSSSFAVNTIPTAVLSLAVGRLANDLSNTPQFASVHLLQKELSTRAKVRVYLQSTVLSSLGVQQATVPVGGTATPGPLQHIGVPADGKELIIFEGNVTGVGRAISAAGTAVATIHLEHWLANLNYASAISATSDPGNPADMVFSAVARARGSTQAASGQTPDPVSWVPSVAKDFVNAAALQDIWGEVLYKWLQRVIKSDPFITEVNGAGIAVTGDTAPILDAIARLAPKNPPGVPLELFMGDGVNSQAIVSGIRASLIAQTGTNWVNTTLWGKLIGEWSPEYFFSVIPRVEDGLIVPFCGPLSGEPWAVIGNEDYVFVKTDAHIPQLLRGVGIVHPTTAHSGLNLQNVGSTNIGYGGFAGFYASEATTVGMVLIKSAPRWLSQDRAWQKSGLAEGAGTNGVVETPVDGPDIPAGPDPDNVAEAEAVLVTRDFMTRYAQQWYSLERLKGRTGEVAGKLRFDICPGSNIMLEADSSADVSVNRTVFLQKLFATVTQVNYIFDVESQKAGTSFQLSHIHSETEHEHSADIIADRPPLYVTAWRGAAMTSGITPEPAEL